MANDIWRSLIQSWVEFKGRRTQSVSPSLGDQLFTRPVPFFTGNINADYLYVFPDTAAVITAPDGKRSIVQRGGYVDMDYGVYTLQYVDLRKHMTPPLSVDARSADGLQVILSVNITWQVSDPLLILGVGHPLEVLITTITNAIKSFIQAHKHDELVLGEEGMRLDDAVITSHIIREVSLNKACRGFAILDVRITNRQGDPQMVEIRQKRILQEKKTLTEKEILQQQRDLIDQKEELIRRQGQANFTQAEQEAELAKKQDEYAAERAKIRYEIEVLAVEIERLRKLPEYLHQEALSAIEVRARAIDALIQSQVNLGSTHSLIEEAHLLGEILRGLPDTSSVSSSPLPMLSASLSSLMPPSKAGPKTKGP